jgi:UDPglucose 6-dehydrogenase
MNICVVGSGYVGLVTGACFAETGHHVVCVDNDETKVAAANRGEVPLFEPGLEELVRHNLAAGRLRFSGDLEEAMRGALAIFVAVGTPSRRDGGADLSSVDDVALAVARHASSECVLVLKSTVPVGTNARVRRLVRRAAVPVHVVSNPEFLKEGAAVSDFMRPDRVVVGLDEDAPFARRILESLYQPVMMKRSRIVWMSPESAELTKYVANTMLAMRISFMNEVASLCERVGADVHHVRHGVGADTRIGASFLYAGPGYGGSCFPKDVQALVHTAHDYGLELELAAATHRVNQRQRGVLTRKLRARFEEGLRGKRIAVWGTSFKPSTDDVRESPAITLIDNLIAEGARVVVHDPQALPPTRMIFGDKIEYAPDPYRAAEGADALVLVTEWRPYQNPDFARLAAILARRLLIDGRNIWTAYHPAEMGFEYEGIGVLG